MNTDVWEGAALKAVDFDCATGYVYWSDAQAIGRCLINGTSFNGALIPGESNYELI